MRDGIKLEKRGVPTAVICTDFFAPIGRSMARILGYPDYPLVVVPHPIGRLARAELRRRAETAAPQVVALLTKVSV